MTEVLRLLGIRKFCAVIRGRKFCAALRGPRSEALRLAQAVALEAVEALEALAITLRITLGFISMAHGADALLISAHDCQAPEPMFGDQVVALDALQAQALDVTGARAMAQRLLEQTARSTDPSGRLSAAKDLAGKKGSPVSERDQLAVLLRSLASLLRDLGILSSRGNPASLANADLEAELTRLAASFDPERSMRAFTAVDRALAALERNASPKIVADWLVLQL